jgi:class 3 adenylate cyclase
LAFIPGDLFCDPPTYVDVDVHAAAPIMSAGHGGQVLLSKATLEQAGADVACMDLGEHRLKDLDEPVWLYQLGSEAFPAHVERLGQEPPG